MSICCAQDDHAGALREAQLLDSLDHPNIIRYRESFVDKDGALCIVTSFCEEGDLFTRIRKKAAQKEYFSEEEAMNMFVQVTSAWNTHLSGSVPTMEHDVFERRLRRQSATYIQNESFIAI